MIKRSKFLGVLSAMALALTMGLLSACGGGKDDNNIVGYWELVSMSGDEAVDEATVTSLKAEGLIISFEATEDHKATLNFFGEDASGIWAGEKGNYTISFQDQEAGTAKVEGSILTLSAEGAAMVFERAEKGAAQSGPLSPGDSDQDEAAVPDDVGIVGNWKLTDISGDDEIDADSLALMEEMGMWIFFVAADDGTVELNFMGDVLTGQWSESGGDYTLDIDGETMPATISGDTLSFESDAVTMTFSRTTEAPAAADDASADSEPADSGGSSSSTYPAFGETVSLPSGVEVTVTGPEKYKLSSDWLEESYPEDQGELVSFEVVIKNGTSDEIEGWSITTKVVSDGKQATEVWDSGGGVEYPNSTILPGKTLTYKAAYQVANANDLQFSFEISGMDDGKVHYLTD